MSLLDPAAIANTIYSGGWRPASGGELPVVAPATGERLATVGAAGPADVAEAAAAAAAAQPAWAGASFTERAAVLRQAGVLIEQHADELHQLMIKETGSVGIVHINDQTVNDEVVAPFGGVLDSGAGARFGGQANLDAFTDQRWITVRGDVPTYPF